MSTTSNSRITTLKTPDKKEYPVELKEFKLHFGAIMENDFDVYEKYLEKLLRAVTREAEAFIQNDIAYTEVVTTFYNFSGGEVSLDEGNYNSLVSIVTDSSTEVTPNEIFHR